MHIAALALRAKTPLPLPRSLHKLPLLTRFLQISSKGQDDRCIFGVSAMQGWRISMEDAHACVLDLKPEDDKGNVQTDSDTRISYFGVYDGHGGDKVAIYAGEHLHNIVAKQDTFKNKNFEQALKDGFLAVDRAILSGASSYASMNLHQQNTNQ